MINFLVRGIGRLSIKYCTEEAIIIDHNLQAAARWIITDSLMLPWLKMNETKKVMIQDLL